MFNRRSRGRCRFNATRGSHFIAFYVSFVTTIFAAIDLKERKNAAWFGHDYGFQQVSAAAPVKQIAFAG